MTLANGHIQKLNLMGKPLDAQKSKKNIDIYSDTKLPLEERLKTKQITL